MNKSKRGGYIMLVLFFGAGWVAGGGNILLGLLLAPASFFAVGFSLIEKKVK